MGATIGALSLIGATLEGASDGEGNFVGDLTLKYEARGGRVINWSVHETYYDPVTGENRTEIMEKERALSLFEGNSRFTSEVYYRVEDSFSRNR